MEAPVRALLLLPFLAAACSSGEQGAEVETAADIGILKFCLTTSADNADPTATVGQTDVWRINGTVRATSSSGAAEGNPEAGVNAVEPCWTSDRGVFVEVVDGEGETWRFGWVTTSGDQDRTPTFDVQVGNTVELAVMRERTFGKDYALVLSDDDGVVLAGEEGFSTRIGAVDPNLIDGLQVNRGGITGVFLRAECGRIVPTFMQFDDSTDGEALPLGIWVEGTVSVGNVRLQARNPGSYQYMGDVSCEDTWGPQMWFAYRP